MSTSSGAPLVLVSNRGPVTYHEDGSVKRGTGGLATALIGLASHRDAVWIASAMTDQDARVAQEHGGRPFEVEAPHGGEFRVRFVASEPQAYDRFYNIFANPMLWFIQHYLWDLSNAPDIRRHEVEAFEFGYNVVNEDLATAVLEEIDGQEEPVVMVHDYQLYTLPGMVRRARPDAFLHHFVHIPWTQPDAWRVLPATIRDEIYNGVLANDIIGFHTRSYRRNFLQCCRDLMDLEVDMKRGVVRVDDREVWVRAYPLPIDYQATREVAQRDRVKQFEEKLLARRREFSILRVDRADLSKNVLRGFTGFDIFLEQHPEFAERITFTAQLMPSRTDVPEYAEYLEKIEALVAVVNHRHGTPDWMPISLKLRDDLEEAVASYKHYDVMMVNAMFDGMNLVAKEGPLVNERDGVSILSENTGAHEELGEFALSVNPFDVQELANSIYAALTMEQEERKRRRRPQGGHHLPRSRGLDRRADRRHAEEGRGGGGGGLSRGAAAHAARRHRARAAHPGRIGHARSRARSGPRRRTRRLEPRGAQATGGGRRCPAGRGAARASDPSGDGAGVGAAAAVAERARSAGVTPRRAARAPFAGRRHATAVPCLASAPRAASRGSSRCGAARARLSGAGARRPRRSSAWRRARQRRRGTRGRPRRASHRSGARPARAAPAAPPCLVRPWPRRGRRGRPAAPAVLLRAVAMRRRARARRAPRPPARRCPTSPGPALDAPCRA